MYNSVNGLLAASVVTLALFCTSNTAQTTSLPSFESFRGVRVRNTLKRLLL